MEILSIFWNDVTHNAASWRPTRCCWKHREICMTNDGKTKLTVGLWRQRMLAKPSKMIGSSTLDNILCFVTCFIGYRMSTVPALFTRSLVGAHLVSRLLTLISVLWRGHGMSTTHIATLETFDHSRPWESKSCHAVNRNTELMYKEPLAL